MLRLFFIIALLGHLQLVTGCNFVRIKQMRLERFNRHHGLQEKYLQLGEDRLHYWEGGTGQPLLLLHGFGGDAAWGWSEQIRDFSKRYHLIIPDLLWFGKSTSASHDFSIEHQAKAMQGLMKHLGLTKYHVAGISYGGLVAMIMLRSPATAIDKAVIIASPGVTYSHADYQDLLRRFQIKNIDELILPTDGRGLTRLLNLAFRDPPCLPSLFHQSILDTVVSSSRPQKIALLHELVSEMESLRNLSIDKEKKYLLVWGSDDLLCPVSLGQRLKDFLGQNAELIVIEGGRHAPNMDFAPEFNEALIRFLHFTQ